MEKIRKNKLTFTVGLLVIAVLLATILFSVFYDSSENKTLAYEISTEAENAVIGDHGVGEAEHLAQGDEDKVSERFNVGSEYNVVWVSTAEELKSHLETASGPVATAGQNKIIVLKNDIDWEQANINNDVGSQKFVGILDGNGYSLNITFSSPVKGGGTAKANNDSYYKVTESDLGSSSGNFSGTDGSGVRGVGLVVGVNAGTIANLTINYTAADGAMRDGGTVDSNGRIEDTNSLDSAQDPDLPYGYGIVTGVNIGTIKNVYVNQQSIFNGNTKARESFNGDSHADPAEAHENCAAVGGIAGINMGYGVINNCYMYVGGAIWAQADGSSSNGADSAARYATTFAGGLVGWIKGNNSQLTYCYLDGSGDVCSWAQRGKNLTLGGQNEPWSISYAGGITAGKIQIYRESNYTLGVERRNCYSVAQPMGANQVKGIISNWTGYRRDSYGSTSYVDVAHTFSGAARARKGMPFDFLYSADQGSDKQDLVVFTFNYKEETGNDTLDLDHYANDGTDSTNAAKMKSNWVEVYRWEHSLYTADGDSEVSVTFEGNYLRIQAKSKGFMEGKDVQLESVTRSAYPNGYLPKYDSSFMGCMIWGTDIYTIGEGVNPETSIASTVQKPTDQLGSYVQYYSTNMSKGSYVVKFGATYDYTLENAKTTSRQYNGSSISDMLPTLNLTDAKGDVTVNEDLFNWKYSGATAGAVSEELTLYPDTYYIQPCAVVDGAENSAYAYYDAAQRTLAVNKGINSTVIVTKATLSLTYSATGWVKSANIGVSFSANNNSNWNTTIIDAYSYQGGTNDKIIDLSLSGTNNFTITENTTTPRNGRTIFGVKAYVKKADGTYIEVADTTKASADKKTATIKIDNAAPVLGAETYYLADQFGGASVDEIQTLISENPDAYTALDPEEVLAGRWYNQQMIVVVNVNDENRSGISVDTIGVQEAVMGGSFGNMDESNYSTVVNSSGEAVIVLKLTGARNVQLNVSDALSNSATLSINGGNFINIDTTPITFDDILSGQKFAVNYSYRSIAGKAFSKLGINFIANFGGSGLNVWYYIDNNSSLGDDVTTEPEGANWEWKKYDFSTSLVSGSEASILIPEGMENAAVFIKFTSGTEGYDVAEPVIMRVVSSDPFYKFTVDLNGADIKINAQYITVNKASTGESYNLAQLINGEIEGVALSEFFSKTYDGTTGIGKYSADGSSYSDDITFTFDVSSETKPDKGDGAFYTGTFNVQNEETNFRTTWLKFDARYTEADAGDSYFELAITTSSESHIEMSISVNYGGATGIKPTLSVATSVKRINMAFDISQIFSEGQGIEMSNGSYTIGEGNTVTFNWVYGDVFDGLVVRIVNDEDGGSMYFRFNSLGKKDEVYMNVGGNYSAYVDAFMIAGDSYQSDDFSSLVYNESTGAYEGNAGLNYFVAISGTIPINVQPKEVRLTFALDGLTRYSFAIPYDMKEHEMTASYIDVDGNTQYAKITWKNSSGADTTLSKIVDIGSYTAVASIQDGNYKIKGQSQQTISITATYLDVLVPDKTVQYNDGKAITYIPDLPEGSPAEGQDIVFTIIYYQKLGDSLQVLKDDNGDYVKSVTEVGEYYVSVTFDPEMQPEGSKLRLYARKEYTQEGSGTLDAYISFTITKADTMISEAVNQSTVYNKGLQIYDYSKSKVLSKSSSAEVSGSGVKLQYWDEAEQIYVDFDPSSNNGKYENVGDYKYRLSYDGGANYNACYADVTLTIQKAKITGVIFGNQIAGEAEGVYGIKQVYTGNPVSLAAQIAADSNVYNNEQLLIEYKKIALGGYSEDVPSYTTVNRNQVWLRVSCGENYEVYEATAYVIITIAPYPDDVLAWSDANPIGVLEVEYDGNYHEIGYTLNTGKYGDSIQAIATMTKQKDAGTYNGTIQIVLANYEGYTYETVLTITPKKVTTVDTSSISEIQQEQGLTSDTDLTQISVTFEGVNGETVEAELIFKDADGKIVVPDSYGCLPAGTYTVTYSGGDNYDLSGVKSGTLTLAEGTGDRDCKHEDKNGDGICDLCGEKLDTEEVCEHVDEDGNNICDKCGASLSGGNTTNPKPAPDVAMYVVLAICGVLIVASVVGVIVAAVVKSKKNKNNNRYNII